MVLLISLSSSRLSIDLHFCQDKIEGLSFWGKAKSCNDINDRFINCRNNQEIHNSCHQDLSEDGCCSNQYFELDLDFDYGELLAKNYVKVQNKFARTFEFNYFINSVFYPRKLNYKKIFPLSLRQNILVLFQTFLL